MSAFRKTFILQLFWKFSLLKLIYTVGFKKNTSISEENFQNRYKINGLLNIANQNNVKKNRK